MTITSSTAVINPPDVIRDRIVSGLRRFADEAAADQRIPITRLNFQFTVVAHSPGEVRAAARTQDAAVDEVTDDNTGRLLSALTYLVYDGLTVLVAYYSPEGLRRYEQSHSYADVVQP
jgi:hypothetical protein